MKPVRITEGRQVPPGSFRATRVLEVACYDHDPSPGFSLSVACNDAMPESQVRQMLADAWAEHRWKMHGGA